MKKKDIVLIAVILAVACSLVFLVKKIQSKGESLRITAAGKEYGVYRLDKDQTIKINSSNICEIRNGKVRMVRADCPDQICVHHKPIDDTGGTIVCLPNRIFMTVIHNKEKTDVPDTVAS